MSGPYKLLPCPFCGPGGSIVEPVKNDYGRWQIACGCCGLHGGNRPDNDLSKMVEHWNTRRPAYAAGRADAGDRIAALEKALLAIKALTKAKNPDPDGSETARQLVNAAASNVLLAQTDKDQT